MQKGFQAVNLHGCASGVIATPVIGENENWWIGNEDTGAVGPQGPMGKTPELAANLTTSVAGKALDAAMGKALDEKCSQINCYLPNHHSANSKPLPTLQSKKPKT